jgi:hypothetical protein
VKVRSEEIPFQAEIAEFVLRQHADIIGRKTLGDPVEDQILRHKKLHLYA